MAVFALTINERRKYRKVNNTGGTGGGITIIKNYPPNLEPSVDESFIIPTILDFQGNYYYVIPSELKLLQIIDVMIVKFRDGVRESIVLLPNGIDYYTNSGMTRVYISSYLGLQFNDKIVMKLRYIDISEDE